MRDEPQPPEKLLGERHKPEINESSNSDFLSRAIELGFSEQEIERLRELYCKELKEAGHEHR